MKKFNLLSLILIAILILPGCQTIQDGFRSQKKNSTDEFLVEKKSPLVMPPDYKKLPLPEDDMAKTNSENKIKKLVSNGEDSSKESSDTNQSLEKSLLEKIKKN